MKQILKKQYFDLTTHYQCVRDAEICAALEILNDSGMRIVDAARLSLELLEATGGGADLSRLRRAVVLGAQQLTAEEHTISFDAAVQSCLTSKSHLSLRTQQDIRQTMNGLMRCCPDLPQRSIRSLTSRQCEQMLRLCYAHSISRFVKARANLSGVFTHAKQQGWCDDNPISRIPSPKIREREICALSLKEVDCLLRTARHPEHRDCLPAIALMLYAGVRPDELRRLSWGDVNWEEAELYIAPRHSKTGGGRHVPLVAKLMRLLKSAKSTGEICPTGWIRRWQFLRQAAGFSSWVPDVLRHSYASYHVKYYKDLSSLQLSMGHRDSKLLLTRYVNLRGISRAAARAFWIE